MLRARCLLPLCLLCATVAAHAEIMIGVPLEGNHYETVDRWHYLASYLSRHIAEPVYVMALTEKPLLSGIKYGSIDLVIVNDTIARQIEQRYQAVPIATVLSEFGPRQGGTIVASRNSGIRSLSDLKDRTIHISPRAYFPGEYLHFQQALRRAGLDLYRDFSQLRVDTDPETMLHAVMSGKSDAAFIRPGELEFLARAGKIDAQRFVVVNKQPLPEGTPSLSTSLVPERRVLALPRLGKKRTVHIEALITRVGRQSLTAQATRIAGFSRRRQND